MIVVSDTSPLNYLILIELHDILPKLFDRILILALSTKADSVLLDERKGRQAARERGLRVSGTLGAIRRAADQGLITLTDALDRLEKTNFCATPKLFNSLRGSTTRSSR
jgi:predicted nucleic acid-binding protein